MGGQQSSEAENSDMGEKYQYDENFHGIETDRKCTDCCMCIFFILFFCGMIALLIVSIPKSNYKYIYIPTDHHGLMCGYDNRKIDVENAEDLPNLENKKYLFWVRPGKPGYSRSFCVEKCPTFGHFFGSSFNQDFADPRAYEEVCDTINDVDVKATIEDYTSNDTERYFCPYATTKLLERCFPTSDAFSDSMKDQVKNMTDTVKQFGRSLEATSTVIQAIMDIYNTYWMIAACVGGALVLSIIWLLLLRCCAPVFVWIAVLLSVAALALLTLMCYMQWKNKFGNHQTVQKYTFGFISEDLNARVFQIFFIILCVIDGIFLLLIIFLFNRIRLSIKIIQFVSQLLGKNPSLFFFPIINYLILFVWWIYVIGVAIVLFGAGTPQRDIVNEYGDKYYKINMNYNKIIQGFAIYHFVGFIWISCFIMALGEMTIAGVVAQFYFTHPDDRKNLPKCRVSRSFFRALRYHTGSLALGSLIITVVKIIRIILEYIDQKTKNSQSDIAKCVIKCCKCCFCILERFLKFLNRNAYTMIAIHGYNFWNGAKNAFKLIVRNCVRVATVNWVGDFTLFLGKLFVAGGVTAFAIWWFKRNDDVQFFIVPACVVFICSYITAGAFSGLFETCIDCMFLCFMEDEERNDGVNHPRYASKKLRKLMSNNEDGAHKKDNIEDL